MFLMTILADMCQKLAKLPDIYKYGPQFVRDKHHLCQAIDYLYYGNRLGDPPGYHSATRMASYLADLGEYVKAIEWQKRAWLLSYKTNTYAVYILCLYMTILLEDEIQKHNTIDHLLRNFLLVLSHAKKQYKYKKNASLYEILYTRRRVIMFTIIDASMEQLSPLKTNKKCVMSNYFEVTVRVSLSKGKLDERAENIETILKTVDTIQNEECKLDDIFKSKSHLPSPNSTAISNGFTYDFFVYHSHEDDNWVDSILVPHTFLEDNIVMKGNPYSRLATNKR